MAESITMTVPRQIGYQESQGVNLGGFNAQARPVAAFQGPGLLGAIQAGAERSLEFQAQREAERDDTELRAALNDAKERDLAFLSEQERRSGAGALDNPNAGQKGLTGTADDYYKKDIEGAHKFTNPQTATLYRQAREADRLAGLGHFDKKQYGEERAHRESVFNSSLDLTIRSAGLAGYDPNVIATARARMNAEIDRQYPGLDNQSRKNAAYENLAKQAYNDSAGAFERVGLDPNSSADDVKAAGTRLKWAATNYAEASGDNPREALAVADLQFRSGMRTHLVTKGRQLASGDPVAFEAFMAGGGGAGGGAFVTPVSGRVTSAFGSRTAPKTGASSNHLAVDIAAPAGTPIVSAGDGVVVSAGTKGGYGNTVVIKHDDGIHRTQYAHMQGFAEGLKEGDRVASGQVIGAVGNTGVSTGPHLDLKVEKNGEWVDPSPYFGISKKGDQVQGSQLGGGATAAYLTPEDQAGLWNAFGEAQVARHKQANQDESAALDRADINGSLTVDMVNGSFTLSGPEKLHWLKVARGELGLTGDQLTVDKKTLENKLQQARESGAIVDQDDLYKFYNDNGGNDLFNRQDVAKHLKELEAGKQKLTGMIDKYMALNPKRFDGNGNKEFKELFKYTALKGLTERRLTDEKDIAGFLGVFDPNNALNLTPFDDKPGVRAYLINENLKLTGADDTPSNQWRQNVALTEGKPLREVMAPDAEDWVGKGRFTLGKTSVTLNPYRKHFEEAGNSYNVDPDLLGAFVRVASRGERHAVSTLRSGGQGLMQLSPEMCDAFGVADPFDTLDNLKGGAKYLDALLTELGGDQEAAIRSMAFDLPEKEREEFVTEVLRLYRREPYVSPRISYQTNYGVKPGGGTPGYQLPKWWENDDE